MNMHSKMSVHWDRKCVHNTGPAYVASMLWGLLPQKRHDFCHTPQSSPSSSLAPGTCNRVITIILMTIITIMMMMITTTKTMTMTYKCTKLELTIYLLLRELIPTLIYLGTGKHWKHFCHVTNAYTKHTTSASCEARQTFWQISYTKHTASTSCEGIVHHTFWWISYTKHTTSTSCEGIAHHTFWWISYTKHTASTSCEGIAHQIPWWISYTKHTTSTSCEGTAHHTFWRISYIQNTLYPRLVKGYTLMELTSLLITRFYLSEIMN